MTDTPRWRRYLRLVKRDVVADVDDELAFHIEMRVADNIRAGLSPDEARAEAAARFGDVTSVRESLVNHDRTKERRDDRREFLGDLFQDVRFGLRSLRRAPGFTIAATLTLALGIGANTAIFSVVDALLLRPLPYARPQELMSIGSGSGGEFLALRERLRTFAEVAAWAPRQYSVDDGRQAQRLEGAAITTNLFRTLGVSPVVGAGFTEEASVPGNNRVVIISDGLWRRQFGARSNAIGRSLEVDGVPHRIIGVMGRDFHYPGAGVQYWLPLAFTPANIGYHWGVGGGQIIGRIKPGHTIEQAQQDVRDTWPTMRRLNPLWDPGESYGRNVSPAPLQETMVGAPRTLLFVLLGCVLVVLLIACVNVANLLLARATARERELAVRAAVGGGRARLVRQLITESVMLSTVGAILGVLLAVVTVKWLVAMLPPGIPRVEEIAVNGTVLLATGIVALLTGLLFGIVPAIRATAFRDRTLMTATRGPTRGASHHRLSGLLVAGEVALAVLLVIGSMLLVRSFNELRQVEPGFESTRVIAAQITPPSAGYRDTARVTALYRGVLERLAATPSVQRVGAVDKLPIATTVWGIAPRIQGQHEDGNATLPDVHHFQAITPGYLPTMGIGVKHGRGFDDGDVDGSQPVAMVSESMAKRFWPNESAVGKRVGYPWPSPWMTIVGVVPDVRQDSLRDTLGMSMYVPWQQRTRMSSLEMWVVARTTGNPAALASTIRSVVGDIDRSVSVSNVRTMDDIIDGSVQRDRFTMIMVGLFALAALLLGAVGIYGVMSYLVSQRTQEMGVRLALGATSRDVLGMVVRRGAAMALVGAVAGVIAAVWATRPLAALLYGVSPTDPLTFAAVPAVFLLVALLASYLPARRATRVDPVKALRAE